VRYIYNVYSQVLKNKKWPFKCQAGNLIGVLDPNGDVRLCELTDVVGNVRSADHDFQKVWFSDPANEMRKKIRDCACTHACFINPSIKMDLPALFRSYLGG
jgi:MoaA/NifB/PqqE/SkfB family radical SAM enzyme